MGSVSIRDLSRKTSKVVDGVASSGRPAIVTKHGRVVAALVPVDERELEDFILANAPRYVRSTREADLDLRHGRTSDAFEFLAELDQGAAVGAPRRTRSKSPARSGSTGRTSKKPRPARARRAREQH